MPAYRYDGSITDASSGVALQGIEVYVCTQPASTTIDPPTPLADLFTDATGQIPLANPVLTDGFGNFYFYAATAAYTLVYIDPLDRMPKQVFPDQLVSTQGGGSVTSVALTMPTEFDVTGSPITAAGILAVAWKNVDANLVLAGPTGGSAGTPGWRGLVAEDFPAGIGTVSSVGLGLVVGALFSGSITGTNPVTSSGIFTAHVDLAPEAANTVLAGPASGSTGPVTARALVAADIFGLATVTFSATPVFDASLFALPTFKLTLTGNVTSSSVTNAKAGQVVNFLLVQDGTGGHSFAWPANFKGASNIDTDANMASVQSFLYDGTNWRAMSPGISMPA